MKPDNFGILVAGMHRSGTSAATGALECLGVSLGGQLMPGAADNPKGYFEHEAVVAAHDALLRSLGSWWSDPRPLPEGWMAQPAARRAEEALVAIVRNDFGDQALWAVKDPRACRLLPLWRRCMERLGSAAGVLHVVRAPAEVATSLRARDGFGLALGELLWLRHVLDAVRESRGLPRAVLLYDDLLASPVQAMSRALEALGIAARLPAKVQADALDGFVEERFRHHGSDAAGAATRVSAMANETYAAFRRLAAGEGDWAALEALEARFSAQWDEMSPWVGAVAESVFPAIDARAALDEQLHALRSDHLAQLAWSEQMVADHRVALDERDALAAQLEQSRQHAAQIDAGLAVARAELAGQAQLAERLALEYRASRDAAHAREAEWREERQSLAASLERQAREAAEAAEARIALETERDVLQGARDELEAALSSARQALAAAELALASAEQASALGAEQNQQLRHDLDAARSELARMTGSASWRLTAPLRALRRLVAGNAPARATPAAPPQTTSPPPLPGAAPSPGKSPGKETPP